MVQSYNPSHKFSLETVRRNLWEDEAQRRKMRLKEEGKAHMGKRTSGNPSVTSGKRPWEHVTQGFSPDSSALKG